MPKISILANKWRERDLNPRTPKGRDLSSNCAQKNLSRDLESCAFDLASLSLQLACYFNPYFRVTLTCEFNTGIFH